jgi:secretion/DNA translocation related TadE-like protein
MKRTDRDAGMATVTVLALGGVASAAVVVGVLLGGIVAARHRAAAAADFAAIAAAERSYAGSAAACRSAAQIAAANRAEVEWCQLSGRTAEVRVRVRVAGPFARLGPARATARAGPTSTRSGGG